LKFILTKTTGKIFIWDLGFPARYELRQMKYYSGQTNSTKVCLGRMEILQQERRRKAMRVGDMKGQVCNDHDIHI